MTDENARPPHSPGPWTTRHGLIYDANGKTVASCVDEDGEFGDPVVGPRDAELIARVPLLLARVAEIEAEAEALHTRIGYEHATESYRDLDAAEERFRQATAAREALEK